MSEDTDFSAFAKGSEKPKRGPRRNKKETMVFTDKKKKERLSVYICGDIKSKVKALAVKHDCPESSIVEQCLEKVLRDYVV